MAEVEKMKPQAGASKELSAADHAAMGHGPDTAAGAQSGTASTHAGGEHFVPSAYGFDATMMVSLAMLVVIGIAIWKKVPAMIASALDKQIASIKEQLDAATNLRTEAEAIKAEYEAKAIQAALDADAMKANAVQEAKTIITNAKKDAASIIVRRAKMAEDKIAAAEAAAIADVRAASAATAIAAAEYIIIANADMKIDAALIDGAISSLN